MKLAVFVAALTLAASSASAATVTLSKQGSSYFGTNGGHAQVKNISNNPGLTADAGGFRLKDQDDNSLIAWCLDVLNFLNLPGTYNTTDDPFSNRTANNGDLTDTRIANITSLFTLNYGTENLLTDNGKSAGFQMALWELVYETDDGPFSVSTGTWHATSTLAAVTWANNFLATLLDPPSEQGYKLTFYQAANGQNLVTAAPVPIPAALALFATALGGLGFFRWMGRKPATA